MVEVLKVKFLSITCSFKALASCVGYLVYLQNGLLRSPSPDRSGNPFMPGFGTKDWNK